MKQRVAFLSCAAVLAAASAMAQNPRGEAKASLAGKEVAIDYGRPSLRGRDMLGQAEIGRAWRMGADSATTLKTAADLSFGSAQVPKGDYVLSATKVAADKWSLTFSSGEKKVAEVPLTSSALKESVEVFTIELKGEKDKGEFEMKWGTTSLKAPFTAK